MSMSFLEIFGLVFIYFSTFQITFNIGILFHRLSVLNIKSKNMVYERLVIFKTTLI